MGVNEKSNDIESSVVSVEKSLTNILEILNEKSASDEDIKKVEDFKERFSKALNSIENTKKELKAINTKLSSAQNITPEEIDDVNVLIKELEESSIASFGEQFGKVKEVVSSNVDNLDEIKSSIESAEMGINAIMSAISMLEEKYKSTNEFLGNIPSLLEKLEQAVDLLNENSVDSAVNKLKTEINKKFKELTKKLEEKGSEASSSDLSEFITKVETTFENIELLVIKDKELSTDKNTIKELLLDIDNKFGELEKYFERNAIDQERFDTRFDVMMEKVENQISGVNKEIESQSSSLSKVLETINGISLDNVDSIKDSLEDAKGSITELKDSVSTSFSENLENLQLEVKTFEENINERLVEFENKITTTFESNVSFNNILDDIKDLSSKKELAEIKDTVTSLNEQFVLQLLNLFENISFAEETEDIKDFVAEEIRYLKDLAVSNESLDERIQSLSDFIEKNSSKNLESLKEDITKILDDFKSTKAQLEEFSSLQVKTGEIQDGISTLTQNVYEVLEKIKEKEENPEGYYTLDDVESDFAKMRLVLSDIADTIETASENDDSFDKIGDSITNISERIGFLSVEYSELSQRINETFENIENISEVLNNETEANEASIEIINTNINELKEEFLNIAGQFEALNEDVESISLRTNKLILTSEDNNKTLKNNIEDFRQVIHQIDMMATPEKISESLANLTFSLNNSINVFDTKLSSIREEIMQVSSSGAVKDSLVEIATWIDQAGGLIETLSTNVLHIKEVLGDKEISERLENIEEKTDSFSMQLQRINGLLDNFEGSLNISGEARGDFSLFKDAINSEFQAINKRFEVQEAKMASIEDKLDLLLSKENKVEMLEGNLSGLTTDIKKLVSYIDEN